MGRRATTPPPSAIKLTTYAELHEIVESFANGTTNLLVIIGDPGLSKSWTLRSATAGTEPLIIKGKISPLVFFAECYRYRHHPIILDDVNSFLEEKENGEFLRSLTESDARKMMQYQTTSKKFDDMHVPSTYWTKSTTCILTNWWYSTPLFQALESRAEMFTFEPSWAEVHSYVGQWYYDQEIFDYIGSKIPQMKQPDCRLYLKAYARKKAGLKLNAWKRLIDAHVETGMIADVRRYLADPTYKSDRKRAEAFHADGHGSIAWFYQLLPKIRARDAGHIPKIKLRFTEPPIVEYPADEDDEASESDDNTIDVESRPVNRKASKGVLRLPK